MSFTEQITWHDPTSREPDDGIDVLVRTPSPSLPVWIGHVDDGRWYWCDGTEIAYAVLAWADLPAGEANAPPVVPDFKHSRRLSLTNKSKG